MSGLGELLNEVYRTLLFLPEQASSRAASIDAFHYVQITLTTAICVALMLASFWFEWRYRWRPGRENGSRVRLPRALEIGTYGSLLAIFLVFWVVGFSQYLRMQTSPDSPLRVYVTAKQWMWKFAYPDGTASAGVLVVPAGEPVQLLLTSRDVIHSFFVPDFRLKRDAVPGTYTGTWFEAPEPGRHPILCAEMCGTGHSRMRGEVVVLPPEEWEAWLRNQPTARGAVGGGATDLVERGRRVALAHGCFACHTVDGSEYIGPTWQGAYGRMVTLQGGERVRVDEAYLTESMMDPQARIVQGFAPIMPSFQGQLEPQDVAALVELIKSLADAPARGEEPRSHGR